MPIVVTHGIATKNYPAVLKALSIGCSFKFDICKTVDSSPQTANELNYDSLYCGYLIQGGFVFINISMS